MKNGFFLAIAVVVMSVGQGFGQTFLTTPTPPPKETVVAEPANSGSEIFDGVLPSTERRARQFWLSADYLLWTIKRGPVNIPLVTAGDVNDANPGAIGQPNTRVLFGDGDLNYHALSGMRLLAGLELADNLAFEGGYFFLGRRSVHFNAGADANGDPFIARPVFNNQLGSNQVYGTSFPGLWTGNTSVESSSALQGYEFNFATTLYRTSRSRFDFLLGFRSLYLDEDLTIRDNLTPLQAGILTFVGGPTDPPNTLSDFDRFHTRNNFYGGQIGGRWEAIRDRYSLVVTGKIAFGATQEQATVDGASTMTTPAGSTTVPGGVLAVPSNMGRYYRSQFAVVPEIGVNLNWQVTERLKATVGYTFLYWSRVARPGNQIDNNVNPALVPTDVDFGNGLGQNRPAFAFHSSDFWAQGVNFGLEFKY